jgi:putative PIN family toxin of toxin-antitoxin system
VFGGRPAAALEPATTAVFQLVTSRTIQAELEETLTTKFGWSPNRARLACQGLWEAARWANPERIVRVARDPDDDDVLACALDGGVQLIVTGDSDLLTLGTFHDIVILTPASFLDHYGGTEK